jgi:hypothetical protein
MDVVFPKGNVHLFFYLSKERRAYMLHGRVSFVKACQDFFSSEPFGRKIEIPEFKALSQEDKVELRELLIEQGYEVAEFGENLPQPA